MSGGDVVGSVLARRGVRFLFTLCGGHISPLLVGAKRHGVRVVDVRDEATAVFAADAVARLTGIPGVAAVTAGPGVTNAVTAVKNAQLAQSPVVLLGGAAATALQGRGALQDIDQLALMTPHVKWAVSVRRMRALAPTLEGAFRRAKDGVPGPVFVELPVDLLYDESVVRQWYAARRESAGAATGADTAGLASLARRWYLAHHLDRLFAPGGARAAPPELRVPRAPSRAVARSARELAAAARPVLLIGSQALLEPDAVPPLIDGVERLGLPTYLSGMARGLLPPGHPLHLRHARRQALHEADLVILAGVPLDFRLDYGAPIGPAATTIAVNRNRTDLYRNRRPTIAAVGDAADFLIRMARASRAGDEPWAAWRERLRARETARATEIETLAAQPAEPINPLRLCRAVDRALDRDAVLVLDGGDFAATASYIVSPRRPLSFLDPGVFGTLGVGAGFALGAKLCRPDADVWILYGDGAAAYSLAELDTFARHGLGVIALVGNDGAWTQIARGQRELLGDDVATVLRRSDYHLVAVGYGARGFVARRDGDVDPVLAAARAAAREGRPALVNALIGTSVFRAGSMSM